MLNIFIFLAGVFILTFLLGKLIEKARIPWIFSALLLGAVLAAFNPFSDITSSETFSFLSTLGMYFLLFMIGFEVNLREIGKRTGFIIRATFFIIFLEAFFGTLVIHYVFGYSWLIAGIVSMSFATVGEAVLIPILDRFKIVNTKLGQSILGIGTFDDLIEIFLLIFVGVVIGSYASWIPHAQTILIIGVLFFLVVLTAGLVGLRSKGLEFKFTQIESLFLVVLALFFLFLGIGSLVEAAPFAALLAGVAVKAFVPHERLKLIEREIKAISYAFFAPLFFLGVGLSLDMSYLVSSPLLILLVVAVSNGAKVLGSYIIAHKELGKKQSVLLGIGVSVRFSTSLVIIKLLFDSGIVRNDLYSVIVASSILFTFIIPVLFSNLLVRWKIGRRN